jgi:hypothetical protein
LRPRDLIEVKKTILNNVPCLLIRPKTYKDDLPTLFHYHGWSSKKENHVFFATTIAQYGYQVILPDSNLHGERNPLDNYSPENLKEYFWEIATKSVKEFQGIREDAQSFYNVDKEAIAVSGSSMGGYISSSIFAQNIDIKCLICFNGGCAWIKTEEILREKFGIEVTKKIDIEEAKVFDPLTYKNNLYPRSILMLHGDADTSVPIEIQKYFHQEVAPYYKNDTKRLKLEIYPNMNHHVSIRMVESAVNWLERYLN